MSSKLKTGEIVVGAAAVAAVGYRLLVSYQWPERAVTRERILVFEDVGEDTACGFSKNAVSVPYERRSVTCESLIVAVGRALGASKPESVRLFVQATKEEVTRKNLKKVLSNSHGLSAVVFIATKDGAKLSANSELCEPLQRFAAAPSPMPFLGNAMALKKGPHEMAAFNAYSNFFENQSQNRTLRVRLPYPGEGESQATQFGIDYDPTKIEGTIMTTDPKMLRELLVRQEDFPKMWTTPTAYAISRFVEKGLFTNSTTDASWKTGHGVLPRYFNAIRIKNYFPIILDKSETFVREWCRLGDGALITDVNDWLTCMTADAVTKASMDYDMRNVEKKSAKEELHPFIKAFRFGLGYAVGGVTAEKEYGKLNAMNPFFGAETKLESRYEEACATCREIVSEITERTRLGEIGGPLSFVTGMLEAKSTNNGEFVQYADFFGHLMNIMIAGHETTAATLGFCLAELANNPDCMAKAVKEIETVLGDRVSPTYEDVSNIPYVESCFREALRMYPPVAQLMRDAAEDTVVLDKYLVRKGQRIIINNYGLHRDPDQWDQGVFGDVDKFNPDRHMPGYPPRDPNAFGGFGFGVRSCIGMQFALLEAKTFLMMMLNFFTFELPDGFKITPKVEGGAAAAPKHLTLRLKFRKEGPLSNLDLFSNSSKVPGAPTGKKSEASPSKQDAATSEVAKKTTPMLILYGSNAGTCEDFAAQLEATVGQHGFVAEVLTLDDALKKKKLPYSEGPVAVVTSTYNGQPPDNASEFMKWLVNAKDGSQSAVQYAVFGVGNSNWEATYQRIPTNVHEGLAAAGAKQLVDLTTADVSKADFTETFEDWTADLVRTLELNFNAQNSTAAKPAFKPKPALQYLKMADTSSFKGEVHTSTSTVLSFFHAAVSKEAGDKVKNVDLFHDCEVLGSKQLQSEQSDRSTCQLELKLPDADLKYESGDHLEVLANNSPELVQAALSVLGLNGEEVVTVDMSLTNFLRGVKVGLPSVSTTSRMALQWLPDLSAPPSRKVIQRLADSCPCPPEAVGLRKLADSKVYGKEVLEKRMNLIEVLEQFRSLSINLEDFCSYIPRLQPRFYSISSSPLVRPDRVTITVGLVEYRTKTGRVHHGAASSVVHAAKVGGNIVARVRQLSGKFKLPKDTATPVVMVGPGTGVAPFIGFLEEREVLLQKGSKLGPAHLFFGCRKSTTDFIYKSQLEKYTKTGVLSADGLHVAFSREDEQNKVYVQDLVANVGEEMFNLLQNGGMVYICGDAKRMAPDVKRAFTGLAVKHGGMNEVAAENWMGSLLAGDRYLEDVWAG